MLMMIHSLPTTDQLLVDTAIKAKKNAYAPYSNFKVGCALLTPWGIFEGCNVENRSYPCGCCAEKAAVAAMVSAGRNEWETLALVADNAGIKPCGMCLQILSEFAKDGKILLINEKEEQVEVTTLSRLYPSPFNLK